MFRWLNALLATLNDKAKKMTAAGERGKGFGRKPVSRNVYFARKTMTGVRW